MSKRILAASLMGFLVSAVSSCGNIFEYNKYDPESYQYPWFSEANLVEKSAAGAVIREMRAVIDNGTVNSLGFSSNGLLTFTLDPACSDSSTYTLELHGVFGLRFAVWSDSSDKTSVPEELIAFDEAGFILKNVAPAWHIDGSGDARELSCSLEVSNDGPLSRSLVFDVICSK